MLLNKPFGIYGVGIAFLLSGIFQFMMQLPQFIIIVKRYRFIFNFKDKLCKKICIFLLMTPTLIGIFGFQINEFVSLNFSRIASEMVISAMNYASRTIFTTNRRVCNFIIGRYFPEHVKSNT